MRLVEIGPFESKELLIPARHSGGRVNVVFLDGHPPGAVMATLKVENRTLHVLPAEQLDAILPVGAPATLRLDNKGSEERRLRVTLPG